MLLLGKQKCISLPGFVAIWYAGLVYQEFLVVYSNLSWIMI